MNIYHITQESDWQAAKAQGFYHAPSLENEGFIHCSYQDQVCDTANRYYSGVHGLVLLEIAPEKLSCHWLDELSTGDELFPHVYGRINLEAVNRVMPFEPQPDGSFTLPLELD
jgi:uncharacterized protein (DUF952 family)